MKGRSTPKLPQSNKPPTLPAPTTWAGGTGITPGTGWLKSGITDKGGPSLVGVSGLYFAASPSKLLTDDPLVGGGEVATLTALDEVVEGGGMGHDSMEGEKMPLEATLTPLVMESWLERREAAAA